MGRSDSKVLPLVPLAYDTVLLPGVSLRLPTGNRPDVAAILANSYTQSSTPRPDLSTTLIGCIPLNSPYLSPEGLHLIETAKGQKKEEYNSDPVQARAKDLFGYGTLARIASARGPREGELSLVIEGVSRFKVEKITKEDPFFEAKITTVEEEIADASDREMQELFAQLKRCSRDLLALIRLSSLIPGKSSTINISPLLARRLELYIARKEIEEAGILADFMVNIVDAKHEEKLRILAALTVKDRVAKTIELLQRNINGLQGDKTLLSITAGNNDLNALRLEALKRRFGQGQGTNGMKGLPPGFGGGNQGEEDNELEELRKRLEDAKLTPEAQKVADREMKRLQKMMPAQAEYGVTRNYLENLAEIPWSKATEDQLNSATLSRARKQLDDDHYGLEKIKKRLLEYLAVLKLKQSVNSDLEAQIKSVSEKMDTSESDGKVEQDALKSNSPPNTDESAQLQILKRKRMVDKSPILLLVGPPGTGKTSLAKSVATALGRNFHRISLGGVRDEAEIRGHRRTYVAAMPGLIVNGLKKVGVNNPVFLLDEIDKVGGSNFHGDPSAAMLEVLDPEQNNSFVDHYVNIPIDLSKVLFIATANTLDTIPPPLLDRMETIQLSGYTTLEKRHIANQHLVPKQILTNGLQRDQITISDEILDKVITGWTRESGVRNLEREIGSICRYKAVQYADAKDNDKLDTYEQQVSLDDLEEILGLERYEEELAATTSRAGIVTGLVAYSSGGQGSILFIEVADFPGNGRVQLTGKLGDVLKESVEVALTWVKAHAYELGLTHDPNEDIMKNRSIHVHCPSGAIPKDGPSAGLAHTIALISLFSGKPVPPTLAMTGEVSLRGKVMPVGGIKEKLIGALRAGVKTVLLPNNNKKDAKDLPQEVKDGLNIVHVGHIWEALKNVWPDAHWPGEHWTGVDSRL